MGIYVHAYIRWVEFWGNMGNSPLTLYLCGSSLLLMLLPIGFVMSNSCLLHVLKVSKAGSIWV
jgi:hypothetical protein